MTKLFLIAVIVLVFGFAVYEQAGNERLVEDNSVLVNQADTSATQIDRTAAEAEGELSPVSSSKVLDLSGQGLINVPGYVFGETSVQELDLSNNNLTGSLQAEVRNLQNLKVLNLSNNTFTGVPAEVGQLKNLEMLDLSNNQLTGLPYELGNLSNLKVLNLKGNAYAEADLAIIKKQLPATAAVLVD